MRFDTKIIESRILIIDDEISIGMMLEETLKESNFNTVRYISDSRQALDVFKEYKPDLILLDICMPHVDGFGVMANLKELRSEEFVPILVLSAETDEDICIRALEAGATDFLNKPMHISETLVRIENLLRIRQLQRELQNRKQLLEDQVKDRTSQLRHMIEELDKANASIREAYIETIYRLTRATEYKDEETADHVKRLSLYTAEMGRILGLNKTTVEHLLYSSPMHDIGKIGIPDQILFKHGQLDDEEWKIMRKHPEIGYEILKESSSPVLKMGAIIALNHHERWDGSGYPNGLKGDQIPVEARILALVDVYDALRSKRHYKPAFDHEKTCQIILDGDGRVNPEHFDPRLLEVFRANHELFKKIYDENSEA